MIKKQNIMLLSLTSFNGILFCQIDKCTIPADLLKMRRKNSLDRLLKRTPSDPELGSIAGGGGVGDEEEADGGGYFLGAEGESGDGDGGSVASMRMSRSKSDRPRTALPSQQLRRWQKLGRVMGVALAMREISRSSKCSSDPELVRDLANVLQLFLM